MRTRISIALLVIVAAVDSAVAFNGHAVTEGPLVLSIDELNDVTKLDTGLVIRLTRE